MTTPENVTFINTVIEELQEHLASLHKLVQKRVLPNSRGQLVRKLDEANTLCQQLHELLQRSGMDRRLGFLRNDSSASVQPVMLQPETQPDGDRDLARTADLLLHAHGIHGEPVNDPDATTAERSGLQDGQY